MKVKEDGKNEISTERLLLVVKNRFIKEVRFHCGICRSLSMTRAGVWARDAG